MVKEKSYDYFWNSDSDRYYDADSMGDWLRPFFNNGVFNGQMQVTANDNMSVTVAAGYGYINGKHRHFLTPTTLDLEVASGTLDRIDSVILRRNDTERRIHLVVEKGGNAKNPVAPAPTREGAVYDLKLAEIYIAAGTVKITQAEITDKRMDADVCGWVAAAVKQIDFKQIQAQFDAYFTMYKKNISDQYQDYADAIQSFRDDARDKYNLMLNAFNTYAEQQKKIYEEWSGGQQAAFEQWRQDQEQTFNDWYLDNTEEWADAFLEWFDSIRDALASVENGEMLEELLTLMKELYEIATEKDIDNIIAGTYTDDENLGGIFEAATEEDIDAIIGGTYEYMPEDDPVQPDRITEIVNSAFADA